ncbi:MAG TPA: GMC family oxidoreductase [Azospirillaceae bacterium]|nr:GMC family oxidoreductase [Azospirillaceae bacterium]
MHQPPLSRRTVLMGALAAATPLPLRPASFLDPRKDGLPDTLDTDLCIVGAGAAGITLALNLAGAPLQVLMLESGGMDLEGETQGLYRGLHLGLPYFDLTACRLRYFGGTTNHWGGYCRPNDPIDYQGRPELGVPAWPIGHDDIAPYLRQAMADLGLDEAAFDPATQFRLHGHSPDRLAERRSDQIMTKVFQLSQRVRFREIHRRHLEDQANLRVLLHANLTHIALDETGRRVRQLTVRTLDGRQTIVRARRVVLACHAIENARLLLLSDDVMREGIGNAHGHVGRNFMEHARIFSGVMIPARDTFPALYDSGLTGSLNVNTNLSLTETAMRKHGVMEYYCRFVPPDLHEDMRANLGRLRDGFWQPFDPGLFEDIADVLGDLPEAVAAVMDKYRQTQADAPYYVLDHRIEQAPNPLSRIVLSRERDALGLRRADLHWALSDLDYATFAKGCATVAREVAAMGWGRFQLEEITPDLIQSRVKGHYHHMGTTRMSANSKAGVVDADLRVHGVENLFVAGSSVFPTAGYGGPTMTLVALAIRLAEHLKGLGNA